MNARITGYEVRLGECEGARCALGKRDGCAGCSRIAWPLDQRRRELTVTYAPGHSTRYDMRHWSRAADGAPPLLPYLCTRQTPLIFLSFIAFVIVRSLTYPIFLSSPRAPLIRLYRPTSCLANKVQRSLLAAIMSFISRGDTFCIKAADLSSKPTRALGDTRRATTRLDERATSDIKSDRSDRQTVVTYRNPEPCIVDLTCR